MAYTTDRTWVTGEVVTAALMNTYVRDNIKWLSTDKPMCKATQTSKNSVNTGVTATLTYDTNTFDNASVHSTTTNTNRMTIPAGAGGKWLLGTYSLMPGQATPGNYHAAAIRNTGVTTISASQVQVINSASFGPGIVNVTLWNPAAAAWADTSYAQDGGGSLTFSAADFWAFWVGV